MKSELRVVSSPPFDRDLKRLRRAKRDLSKMWRVVRMLRDRAPLPSGLRKHALRGQWAGSLECHIEEDWLLVWKVVGGEVHLLRTGAHGEIFRK